MLPRRLLLRMSLVSLALPFTVPFITKRSRQVCVRLSSSANLITSSQSNTIKKIQALLNQRKKRQQFRQVVVEGPRMVMDLVKNPATAPLVSQIIVTEKNREKYATTFFSVFSVVDRDDNNQYPVQVTVATDEVLNGCTDTVNNQGVVAIVDMPKEPSFSLSTSGSLILVLDGVADPGNLGTLLRSACAVGVRNVVLLPSTCDPFNPKALRAAMGTTFLLQVACRTWDDMLTEIGSDDVEIYAAIPPTEDSEAIRYDLIDWATPRDHPAVLIIGNEGNGLSDTVRQTGRIRPLFVPMVDGVESLNAAVCGSVILFEYQRQLLHPK